MQNKSAFSRTSACPALIGTLLFSLTSLQAQDLNHGLMAYYPFNGNAQDESGDSNNGTVNGATLTTDHNGNADSAYNFANNDQWIEVVQPAEMRTLVNYSVSAWVKVNIEPFVARIVSTEGPDHSGHRGFRLIGSRKAAGSNLTKFSFGSGWGGGGDGVEAAGEYQNDNWYHLVGTYDGNNYRVYVNGILDGTKAAANHTLSSNHGTYNKLNIGLFQGNIGVPHRTGSMPADIDEVRIYNRGLSAGEVSALYDLKKPETNLTTGLVAHYPFNGNAEDESGNGNNGTVNGATLAPLTATAMPTAPMTLTARMTTIESTVGVNEEVTFYGDGTEVMRVIQGLVQDHHPPIRWRKCGSIWP